MADKDADNGIRPRAKRNLGKGECADVTFVGTPYIPAVEDDTQPNRISYVRNVETPSESTKVVGQSQERLKSLTGIGGTKKRMPSAERQREIITGRIGQDA